MLEGGGGGLAGGSKKNAVAGGHILAASALKGPKRTITFSQVSSDGGCWGFLPDFLPSFSPPLVLPRCETPSLSGRTEPPAGGLQTHGRKARRKHGRKEGMEEGRKEGRSRSH